MGYNYYTAAKSGYCLTGLCTDRRNLRKIIKMRYTNIIKAKFISQPNRFIALVETEGGEETVHVKNTGRCRKILVPGCTVYLTTPGSPGRKTKYDLVAAKKSNGLLINIDSQAPNKVMNEWLKKQGFDRVVPEYTYGDACGQIHVDRVCLPLSVGA